MSVRVQVGLELAPKAEAQAGLIGHLTVRLSGIELRRVDGDPVVVLPVELERLVLEALGLGPEAAPARRRPTGGAL